MLGRRLERAKVIAKRKFRNRYHGAEWLSEHQKERELLRMRKTGTPCSCTSCGNPRRHFKAKTRQEIKSNYEGLTDFEREG